MCFDFFLYKLSHLNKLLLNFNYLVFYFFLDYCNFVYLGFFLVGFCLVIFAEMFYNFYVEDKLIKITIIITMTTVIIAIIKKH